MKTVGTLDFKKILSARVWKPDEMILKKMRREISSSGQQNGRLCFDGKNLSWTQMLEEIRKGTKIGRVFYAAYTDGPINGGSK